MRSEICILPLRSGQKNLIDTSYLVFLFSLLLLEHKKQQLASQPSYFWCSEKGMIRVKIPIKQEKFHFEANLCVTNSI